MTGGAEKGGPRAPRTILYTGKGGVGKTSVAAATARRCAARGLRTVILSTDAAHSLGDSLGMKLGPEPTPVCDLLWAQEVDAQREMEVNWAAVQDWLGRALADRGVLGVAAEELTVPPGIDELFSLLQIREHHRSAAYDVIVVDCAPTGETLRLLSFPDVAQWWLDKVLPWERRLVTAARPLARKFLDVPLPGEDVFSDVQRLVGNLIAMNGILRDRERTSIRLVMNPDRMVIREAQRTYTYLNLYGYLTDAVVVNRIFPEEVDDSYFGAWRERQAENLELVRQGFDPVPLLRARYFPEEVMGPAMLDRLGGELFADRDPEEVMYAELAQQITSVDGRTVLSIRVPFADRSELQLSKVGQELIVRAGREKRTIILPAALARLRHAGARLEDGKLEVSFVDDRKIPASGRGHRDGPKADPGEAVDRQPAEPAEGEGATRWSRQRA
ncbi:MAG: ArsA family ATPase [Solirubrobacterales bacterium]|nr:ArsA family ATPase [Solirubrobacterales bacterium]